MKSFPQSKSYIVVQQARQKEKKKRALLIEVRVRGPELFLLNLPPTIINLKLLLEMLGRTLLQINLINIAYGLRNSKGLYPNW